jgi:hypothetical protein
MEIHLKIIGGIMILLAFAHAVFPRYFDWATDLKPLSAINRQIMYVHTFFIAFVVFLMGVMCISSAPELIETNLGHKISLGLFIFWFFRLLIQFFGYSSDLWRGKRFETIIHILFSILWLYFSIVFSILSWAAINATE